MCGGGGGACDNLCVGVAAWRAPLVLPGSTHAHPYSHPTDLMPGMTSPVATRKSGGSKPMRGSSQGCASQLYTSRQASSMRGAGSASPYAGLQAMAASAYVSAQCAHACRHAPHHCAPQRPPCPPAARDLQW